MYFKVILVCVAISCLVCVGAEDLGYEEEKGSNDFWYTGHVKPVYDRRTRREVGDETPTENIELPSDETPPQNNEPPAIQQTQNKNPGSRGSHGNHRQKKKVRHQKIPA